MAVRIVSQQAARPLAIVTGASSGMGAAFARKLAQRGYDLLLVARRLDRLQALASELEASCSISAACLSCDLSRTDAHLSIMAHLGERPVVMLVNCAGYSIAADYIDTDWAAQRDCIMTLVMAVCGLTHAVLPGMVAAGGGRIITIGSVVALSQGGRGHTVYPAAKSFLHKFSLSIDAELRDRGVVATCVLPGSTDSEFQSANGTADAMAAMPKAFIASPEQVVKAALRGNDQGRRTVIPGWYNQLGALVMTLAPASLIRWASARAASKFSASSPAR
jgi:short-subunit dehydrogenase